MVVVNLSHQLLDLDLFALGATAAATTDSKDVAGGSDVFSLDWLAWQQQDVQLLSFMTSSVA